MAKGDDSFIFPFKSTSWATITQQWIPCSTHKHAWEIHTTVHLKSESGFIGMSRESRKRGGQGQWCSHSLVPPTASVRVVALEKSGWSPHTIAWSVRGAEGKGSSLFSSLLQPSLVETVGHFKQYSGAGSHWWQGDRVMKLWTCLTCSAHPSRARHR